MTSRFEHSALSYILKMPLRYKKLQTDVYLPHDITYVNYYLNGRGHHVFVPNSDSRLEYDNQDAVELQHYSSKYLPSLSMSKYLIKDRVIFGYFSGTDVPFYQLIQKRRADLIKHVALQYFNKFGDIDEILNSATLYDYTEIMDWFEHMGFKYEEITDSTDMGIGGVKMLLRFSGMTPDTILEYCSSDLELPAFEYLVDICTTYDPDVYEGVIIYWDPDKVRPLIEKKFPITDDVIECAKMHGNYDELVNIINENDK